MISKNPRDQKTVDDKGSAPQQIKDLQQPDAAKTEADHVKGGVQKVREATN